MTLDFEQQLFDIVTEQNVKKEEALARHTTFKIGGPAEYFITPKNQEELIALLKLCKECYIPFYIMGNGSNLLVGDKGFRGVIIQIYNTLDCVTVEKKTEEEKVVVTAGAGILLSKLAMQLAKEGIKGFEFAAGIPGTLGGAVTMNAGAYDGEIKDSIINTTVVKEDGTLAVLSNEQLKLGYRTSIIQNKSYVVVSAQFQFETGNVEDILNKIADFNKRRREKQPLEYPSAGSTFKRPEGYFAGKLIEDAGLRGYRVGDVMVSEKHCGFVVNVGKGTAEQVRKLIQDVDDIIYKKSGIHLEPEIRFLGDF